MESSHDPLRVTFFPPLHHQRRIWILDILRRERLTQIIDIGCGGGALLATLCQPAPWIEPIHFQDDDHQLSTLFDNLNVGLNDYDTPDLHATRIAGLDISTSELEIAAQNTSPTCANPLYTRWEPLDVELWQGSVDAINPAFFDVPCIVASELIEHLMDDILVQVAPIVLGVYQPRMFLVTTPSYTFNPRWSPPGTTDPKGYLDPTGRTNRTFRHLDHKFEWTVDEFVQWCQNVAQQWGYTVETSTIGIPKEQDPWGREGSLGGATQVASFRRLDDRFSKAAREHGTQDMRSTIREPHTLVTRHHYEAHPRAGHPSDFRDIEEAMVVKFRQWGDVILGAQELWFADDLSTACGGSIDVMLDAAEQSAKLELHRVAGQQRGNWKIQLISGLTKQVSEEIAPAETENVVCEDDDYDGGDTSFDPGVDMGMTLDGAPWRPKHDDLTQAGEWAMHWEGTRTGTAGSEWKREP